MAIYERDAWSCGICGEAIEQSLIGTRDPLRPSIDHVIPWSHGGGDDDSNLRAAHFACNVRRGNRVEAVA